MAIETSLAPKYWRHKILMLLLLVGFGCWGLYDGYWAYPAENVRFERYQEFEELTSRSESGVLTLSEQQRLEELRAEFPPGAKPPKHHGPLDLAFQRFIIPGICFPIGALVGVTWAMSARRRYVFEDDGTLRAPEGVFPPDRQTGLNLARWKSKSIAVLEIDGGPAKGGSGVKLDAFIYEGMEEIIDRLDRRFHPEEHAEPKEVAVPAAAKESGPPAEAVEPPSDEGGAEPNPGQSQVK